MSFFKDAGRSFIKYSEKLVEKTEEYTKIAKLTLDIKKLESNIEKVELEVGKYVMGKAGNDVSDISLKDEFFTDNKNKIDEYKNDIESKRQEISAIKAASKKASEDKSGGTQD